MAGGIKNKVPDEVRDKILELYKIHRNCVLVSKEVGLHKATVARTLKDAELKEKCL